MQVRLLLSCLATAILAGCSTVKDYRSAGPENLHVHSALNSGATLRTVFAVLDVHRLDAKCETDLLGRIELNKPDVDTGLPVNEPLYLEFLITNQNRLSARDNGTIRYHTLLTPRAGYDYAAKVVYDSGIYEVVLRETQRGKTAGRIIERRPLSTCGKS